MKNHLDELLEKRQQLSDAMDAFVENDDFDPESEEFRSLQTNADRIEKQIEAVNAAVERRHAADQLANRMGRSVPVANGDSNDDIGQQLVQSERFQAWKRSGASGRAKLMEIPMRRALITTATPGLNITPDRVYATPPRQQATLLSYLNKIQTSSGSVEVITYPSADPVAGVVPEGTLKPEAVFAFAVNPVNLVTIAHWVETTRQVIEDEQRLRDFLSNSLIRGVLDKAEAEAAATILGGVGYGDATDSESMLRAIRIAIAQVYDAGYTPTGVLLNPLDAASLDFDVWTATNGSAMGGSIWGVPVIPNGAIPAGSAYVADFGVAFHHYYRGSADLFVSDSDVGVDGVSNFKRNILTFLAEYRAKTAVIRPEAVSVASVGTAPLLARSTKPAPKSS